MDTITIHKSRTLHNFIIKANGAIVLDCCRKRSDAQMLRRWFLKQLTLNPREPGESWRDWEGRLLVQRPQTYAYAKIANKKGEVRIMAVKA